MPLSKGPLPPFPVVASAGTLLNETLPLVVSRNGVDRLVSDLRTSDPDGWRERLRVGLYARVSSPAMADDLERQLVRLRAAVAAHGLRVTREEAEMLSGADGRRARLRSLLADPKVTVIAVETADRLTPLNGDLIEACLKASERRLLVLDHTPPKLSRPEMSAELTGLITRFLRGFGYEASPGRVERTVAAALGKGGARTHSARRRTPRA